MRTDRNLSTLPIVAYLSFSFDFVTEPLLDFVTGFTEAIELFGLAAFLTRQTVRRPPFSATEIWHQREARARIAEAGAGHRVRCRTLSGWNVDGCGGRRWETNSSRRLSHGIVLPHLGMLP
jgi:hypothetical protein